MNDDTDRLLFAIGLAALGAMIFLTGIGQFLLDIGVL